MDNDTMTYDEMYDYALKFSGNEDFAYKVANNYLREIYQSDCIQKYIDYRLLQESLLN